MHKLQFLLSSYPHFLQRLFIKQMLYVAWTSIENYDGIMNVKWYSNRAKGKKETNDKNKWSWEFFCSSRVSRSYLKNTIWCCAWFNGRNKIKTPPYTRARILVSLSMWNVSHIFSRFWLKNQTMKSKAEMSIILTVWGILTSHSFSSH